MISRRTIEAHVSKSVVIRDKQKHGIRRIICKYGQGNSCVTNKKIFGGSKDKLILGSRECSNKSNWGRSRNNDKFEEFVLISATSSNGHK